MSSPCFRILTSGLTLIALSASASAQCHVATLRPEQPYVQIGLFGSQVCVEGNRMVTVAPRIGPNGTLYVYERTAAGWQLQTTAQPLNPQNNAWIGFRDLALAGDRVAVDRGGGNVVIFERDAAGYWLQTFEILGPPGAVAFGEALRFDGDHLFVGAWAAPEFLNEGRVFIYQRGPTGWTLEQEIVAPDTKVNLHFGYALDVEGDDLLIGTIEDAQYSSQGSVYHYRRTPNGFGFVQKLGSPTPAEQGRFGAEIELDGGRVLISASGEDGSGKLYFGSITNGVLSLDQTLGVEYGDSDSSLGFRIALKGARAFASVMTSLGEPRGLHMFELIAGAWQRTDYLSPEESHEFSSGLSIGFDGDEVLLGQGSQTIEGIPGVGTIWVFDIADEPYGAGCIGAFGPVPRLDVVGCPLAGTKMGFEIEAAHGGGLAFVAIGFGAGQANLGFGCSLLTTPIFPNLIGGLPLSGNGIGDGWLNLGFVVPANLAPGTFYLQAFCSDPFAPLGFSATNGTKLTIE